MTTSRLRSPATIREGVAILVGHGADLTGAKLQCGGDEIRQPDAEVGKRGQADQRLGKVERKQSATAPPVRSRTSASARPEKSVPCRGVRARDGRRPGPPMPPHRAARFLLTAILQQRSRARWSSLPQRFTAGSEARRASSSQQREHDRRDRRANQHTGRRTDAVGRSLSGSPFVEQAQHGRGSSRSQPHARLRRRTGRETAADERRQRDHRRARVDAGTARADR